MNTRKSHELVNLYGISKKVPGYSYDKSASDETVKEYLERLDDLRRIPYGCKTMPWGYYSTIFVICLIIIDTYELDVPEEELKFMGFPGKGSISSQEACHLLAKYLIEYVDYMRLQNAHTVYVNTKRWYYRDKYKGITEITPITLKEQEILATLNAENPQGLTFKKPVIEGVEYFSDFYTDIGNILSFAKFLTHCNGFQIH